MTDDTGGTQVEEGSHLKSGCNRRNRSQAGSFHSLLKKPPKWSNENYFIPILNISLATKWHFTRFHFLKVYHFPIFPSWNPSFHHVAFGGKGTKSSSRGGQVGFKLEGILCLHWKLKGYLLSYKKSMYTYIDLFFNFPCSEVKTWTNRCSRDVRVLSAVTTSGCISKFQSCQRGQQAVLVCNQGNKENLKTGFSSKCVVLPKWESSGHVTDLSCMGW